MSSPPVFYAIQNRTAGFFNPALYLIAVGFLRCYDVVVVRAARGVHVGIATSMTFIFIHHLCTGGTVRKKIKLQSFCHTTQ